MIRIENPSTGGSFSIPQLTVDPVTPDAESAWVLRSGSGASVTGGGTLKGIVGLATYYISTGSGSPSSYTYQVSYRTLEGTTIRGILS